MINDHDVDNWKTESDSNRFARRGAGSSENTTLMRMKNSSSNSEIRYINPAIYTESIAEDKLESSHEENSECLKDAINPNYCNFNTSVINLPITTKDANTDTNERPGQNTYRCYSTSLPDCTLLLESSTARSETSSGDTTRVERRCKIGSIPVDQNEANVTQTIKQNKCVLDGRQVMRISTASLSIESNDRQTSNRSDLGRKLAYSEWMRKKQEAAQKAKEKEERAAKKRQEEAERIAREKEEKVRLEKENFIKWVERKRQQELDKKAVLENELELQRRLKEIEDNLAGVRTTSLRQWFHKKKEEQKARRKEQETKQKEINEERERRLEQSVKAYEKWRENSKNKPKPATQGLLPHQKAKPAYVNPIPWQSIVEIDSDETQEDTFHEKKKNINQLKMSGRKTIAAHE